MNDQFICANPKCNHAIAFEVLNNVQLEVLRRWNKTCPQCGKRTKWIEQTSLLNTQITNKTNGGSHVAVSNSTVPKSESQKRRANRHDGRH